MMREAIFCVAKGGFSEDKRWVITKQKVLFE